MRAANSGTWSSRVEQIGDELMIRRRAGTFSFWVFQAILLIVLGSGSVELLRQVFQRPSFTRIVLTVPVLTAWLANANGLAWVVFGSSYLRIGPAGVEFQTFALILLQRRRVPLGEIHDLVLESNGYHYGLRVGSLGKPFRFDLGKNMAEALYLDELCQAHLARLLPDAVAYSSAFPPSDCEIRRQPDDFGVSFDRKTRASELAMGAVWAVQMLWIIRIYHLFAQEFQGLSWFIPLVMGPYWLGGFFATLALVRRFTIERWTLGAVEITSRFTVFGFGPSRQISTGDVERVELREQEPLFKGLLRRSVWNEAGDGHFSLVFRGRDGDTLLTAGALTEGEACWMGHHVSVLLKVPCDEAAPHAQLIGA